MKMDYLSLTVIKLTNEDLKCAIHNYIEKKYMNLPIKKEFFFDRDLYSEEITVTVHYTG